MWKCVFHGVVHPERATFELGTPVHLQIAHKEAQFVGSLTVWIYKNQVTAALESELKPADFATVRNFVGSVVSNIVDCGCLNLAVGYDVELISAHDVNEGTTVVFGPEIYGLSVADNELRTVKIGELLLASEKHPLFRKALTDFRNAIRDPEDTGFFCYRAVESLIHAVRKLDGIGDKKKAIAAIEVRLDLHSSCINMLRDLATNVRHGEFRWTTGHERELALRITREILQRFARSVGPDADPSARLPLLTLSK